MKRILAIFVVLTLVVSVFASCKKDGSDEPTTFPDAYVFRELPESVYAEAAASFAGGSGTESDPYKIADKAQLYYFAKLINEGKEDLNSKYNTAHYVLTADIALNDTADYESWSKNAPEHSWLPADNSMFKGVFDGKGHTVSGMYINVNSMDDTGTGAFGLFGDVSGTVMNVNIEKAYISVSGYPSYVGSVAGNPYEGAVIKSCKSDAVIDAYEGNAGGIAGNNSGTISDCEFSGTINQTNENSFANLGGIVGDGGTVKACLNKGNINGGDVAGGISGRDADVIQDCTNEGTINGAAFAGGITGKIYYVATNLEYKTTECIIKNCTNKGEVEGSDFSGGIVASMGCDESEYTVIISDCVNDGAVSGVDCGGIVGQFMASRSKAMKVEDCVNNADISCLGKASGIVCQLGGEISNMSGKVVISNCENKGAIKSSDMYAGGVLAYYLISGAKYDLQLEVTDCINSGIVESTHYAGGIMCFTSAMAASTSEMAESSSIKVSGCKNSGDIITHNNNAYIGGIVANWGAAGITSVISDCTNSGTLKYLNEDNADETADSEEIFTISRIAGGIIGRIGEGTFLTVDNDAVDDAYINCDDAVILVKNCKNTGKLEINYDDTKKTEDGKEIYKNFFGGIIGNTCGEKEFSVKVEGCKTSGIKRGIGHTDIDDIV